MRLLFRKFISLTLIGTNIIELSLRKFKLSPKAESNSLATRWKQREKKPRRHCHAPHPQSRFSPVPERRQLHHRHSPCSCPQLRSPATKIKMLQFSSFGARLRTPQRFDPLAKIQVQVPRTWPREPGIFTSCNLSYHVFECPNIYFVKI